MKKQIFFQATIFFSFLIGTVLLLAKPPQALAGPCFNDGNCSCNQQCINFSCQANYPQVSYLADCMYNSNEFCQDGYYYYNAADGSHQYSLVGGCQDAYTAFNNDGSGCYDNGSPAATDPQYVGCRVGYCVNSGGGDNFNYQCNTNYWASNGSGCGANAYCAPNGDLPYMDCACAHYCDAPDVNPNDFCADGAKSPTYRQEGYGIVAYAPNNTTNWLLGCNAGSLNFGQTVCYSPFCNAGSINCGAWSSPPANTCYSGNISRTCTHNQYTANGSTYNTCYEVQFTDYGTSNNCYTNYTCSSGTCVTHIYVNVYKDYNHDGSKNGNDAGLNGVTVTDNGGNFPTTGSNGWAQGQVIFGGKTTGNYNISITVPSGYQAVGATTKGVSLTNSSGNVTVNFYVTPLYTISGKTYSDKNKNQNYDGSDSVLSGLNVNITGNGVNSTVATDGSGNYTFSNLLSGNYTVGVTSPLPAGYEYTTPYSWAVTVGDMNGSPSCQVSTSQDGVCGNPNNGSISGLNFGATNERPHYNSVCLDVRTDNSGGATISDPLPAAPATCGGQNGSEAIINNGTCSTGSGIVFSCNGTFDFDLGTADANNWTAGGPASQDSECYTGTGLDVIPTSYDYLMTTAKESNITPTNLDNTQPGATASTSCDIADCQLPSNLPKGIYQVQSDLTLHAGNYTFPAPADPTKISNAYIILVNGDLHINGNIYVPKGSVVVFSVSGSIYIDKSVGNVVSDPNSSSVNNPNLEGVYSSDHYIYVGSYGSGTAICNVDGTPLDRRLVILGVVVTNASKEGGSMVNNRDLCEYDTSCSSVQTGDGNGTDGNGGGNGSGDGLILNYILDIIADGKFLMNKNFNWQELKP